MFQQRHPVTWPANPDWQLEAVCVRKAQVVVRCRTLGGTVGIQRESTRGTFNRRGPGFRLV
eukprot:12076122-Karenia_brevis.AAC.1